jgi:uncharacterized protein (DUF362 family)
MSPPSAAARRSRKSPRRAKRTAQVDLELVHVAIVEGAGAPASLLREAVERAGLWPDLARAIAAADVAPAELAIVIKPELGAFARASPAATDPALVEALIDLLHERGFTNVAVAAARDSAALWAENRDVLVLADLLGYRFSTSGGVGYDIVDLGEDLGVAPFPEGAVLHGSTLARPWQEAGYRIVFAKSRTDERNAFALGLESLIGVLPLEDKDYYYHHRFDAAEVAVELLHATPIDFALVDAVVSAHGSAGGRAPLPISTNTIIAARSLVLADYAAAAKMGLDPHVSPVMARALRDIGLPAKFRVDGSLTPYAAWRNVHPLIVDSTRKRDAWVAASRTMKPWLQSLDSELFPLKNPVNAKVNGAVARYFMTPDEDPFAFWLLVATNYYLSGIHRNLEIYRTFFDKDGLRRRPVSLGLDLAQFQPEDYERAAAELQPIAAMVEALEPDADGLRWRYLDEAIVFEFARVIPIPFDEFVAKVDVSRTIQFMNDYIGGVAVPVARDDAGRVTRQAERNLYLPQPNYLVLYEGSVIDVTKLEHATYGADEHRMVWKTIRSENDSARFDDGIVTFARVGEDTRVSICGRQLFTLPLFWQAVNLDLLPEIKALLVKDAYTTFFRRTMANFEAIAEGRDIAIGQPWHDPAVAPGTEPLPIDRLSERFLQLKDKLGDSWLEDLKGLLQFRRTQPAPALIDAEGFRHFAAPARGEGATSGGGGAVAAALKTLLGEVTGFWRDIVGAMHKDLTAATAARAERS